MELGICSEMLVGTRLYGVTSQARGNSVVTSERALDFTCWGKPYCMRRDTDCPLADFTVYSAYFPCVYPVTLSSCMHFVIGKFRPARIGQTDGHTSPPSLLYCVNSAIYFWRCLVSVANTSSYFAMNLCTCTRRRRPDRGLGGQSSAGHRGGSGVLSGQSCVGYMVDRLTWDRFFSGHFSYLLSVYLHQCCTRTLVFCCQYICTSAPHALQFSAVRMSRHALSFLL